MYNYTVNQILIFYVCMHMFTHVNVIFDSNFKKLASLLQTWFFFNYKNIINNNSLKKVTIKEKNTEKNNSYLPSTILIILVECLYSFLF